MAEKVSLAIITLNEEDNLERCIKSVPFADEVIVVDSGSTDSTREVAERLGAKFTHQSWLGFEKQKQKALELTQNNWVLVLDADEALSENLQREVRELLAKPELSKHAAYKVPRLSFHFGRWIRHGGWYPDYQIRLVNKQKAKWSGGELHEFVEADSVGRLDSDLQHFVFKSLSHQVQTNDRYSSLGAELLSEKGEKFSLLKMLIRAEFKFVECYILKQGFRDGIPGLIIAVGAAYSMFLRYAKLYERQKK